MAMNPALLTFFVIAAFLRLGSVFISRRNEARLRAHGAEEYGIANSRLLVALHTLFYIAVLLEGWWRGSQVDALMWLGVALYLFAMLALAYVIHELGGLWTVKVLLAPNHVLNQSWLFRSLRHPNYYLNIIPELLALVLIMKAWWTLVILYPCYLATLIRRIRMEEAAMRQRFSTY
jgi:isoprenylcysteine carboxyl methyltransferase (ICMT) family protein YpbQ